MVRFYCVTIRSVATEHVEFIWAENATAARKQAIDAYPTSTYGPVTLVPYVEAREEAPS